MKLTTVGIEEYGCIDDNTWIGGHAVGQLKTDELERYKSPEEMAMFRMMKAALDPQRRLNPGKVLAN